MDMDVLPPVMPPAFDTQSTAATLIRLRGLYPSLKKALKKVADVILSHPERSMYASINEVAAAAGVSDATVMRFCRILGFKGFQDFKIALARDREPACVVAPSESNADAIVNMVYRTNESALKDTLEILDVEALNKAAKIISDSRNIVVIGVSGSGPVVAYTGNRLLVLGFKAYLYTDFYLMQKAAALLTSEDIVLAISNLGTSREILETVGVAKDRGARIVSITNNSLSALARMSCRSLITASRYGCWETIADEEDAALPCQIFILDVLFALIAQAQGRFSLTA